MLRFVLRYIEECFKYLRRINFTYAVVSKLSVGFVSGCVLATSRKSCSVLSHENTLLRQDVVFEVRFERSVVSTERLMILVNDGFGEIFEQCSVRAN